MEIMEEETKPVTYSSAPIYTAVDHNEDSGAPVETGQNAAHLRQAADLKKQAWPQMPPNLNNGMDCADAPRNLRENLASEIGEWTWLQNRNACLSELSLSLSPFLTTLLFECLPSILSWPLCTLIEGSAAAANRHLNPLTDVTPGNFPFRLLGWIFNELTLAPQGVTWAFVFFSVAYASDLPVSAPFEIFGMILLAMLAKALVVSCKYGFKSDLLLSTGMTECLYNEGYRQTKQGDRGQMSEYVLNLSGLQKEELLKFIYKSQLLANTDLSCTSFSWQPLGTDRAPRRGQNLALQVWEAMTEITKDVEEDSLFAETDTDQSGDITLEEMQARTKQALGVDYDEDEVRAEFERLDANGDKRLSKSEMRARSTLATSKLMFNAKHGLLNAMLREDEQTLRLRIQAGELPAIVLAVLIVVECSSISPRVGFAYMLALIAASLIVSFLPAVVRASVGMSAFGEGWKVVVFNSITTPVMFGTAFPLLLYFIGPCIWLYRQLLICQRLLALISVRKGLAVKWRPEVSGAQEYAEMHAPVPSSMVGGSINSGISRSNSVAGGRRGTVGNLHLDEILLDLRSHSNVTAWAALWRVLHGTAFMPATQIKFQFYGLICTGVFFISAGLDAFGDVILASSGSERKLGVDFKITSLVRLILFTVPLIAMTLLSFAINRYPAAYMRALHHACVSASSTAAALRRPRGPCCIEDDDAKEELIAELELSCGVMSAVISEVESAGEVEPMRVLFLKAEPAVVSVLTSAIFAVVALQLRGVSAIVI